MTTAQRLFRPKHKGTAPIQRPPLASVEERTHPDAQPRFPLFSSVAHYRRNESTFARDEGPANRHRQSEANHAGVEYAAAVAS